MRLALPGFGGGPPAPAPLPPIPTREDPAVVEARNKLRQSELRRRGRAATMVAPSEGELGNPNVNRPQARSAQLLGQAGG